MTDVTDRKATHICNRCWAYWRKHDDGTWSLVSPSCGPCCDNAEMGIQIVERPTVEDAQQARRVMREIERVTPARRKLSGAAIIVRRFLELATVELIALEKAPAIHREASIAPYVEALRETRKQIRHSGMCHAWGRSASYCSCGARDAIAQIDALLENG